MDNVNIFSDPGNRPPVNEGPTKATEMNKTTSVLLCILFLIAGYFIGREHLKYEMRQSLIGLATGIAEVFSPGLLLNAEKPEDQSLKRAQMAYSENLTIYDLAASYKETYLEGRKALVAGKIRNDGDKTLKRVELLILFLDTDGNTIHEHTDLVVYGKEPPLRPGYIREFTAWADKVPSEWATGRAKVGVKSLEFED